MSGVTGWTLGILAGGRSTRMGRDKADLLLDGRTLIAHAAHRLAPPGVPVRVATRPDGPGRDGPFPALIDPLPGAGPLAGMLALLEGAPTPWVLVVACDQPLLPPDLGARLVGSAGDAQAVALELGGETQPLPLLLSRELAGAIRGRLLEGGRRALSALDSGRVRRLSFEGLWPTLEGVPVVANVNRPEALAAVRAALRCP